MSLNVAWVPRLVCMSCMRLYHPNIGITLNLFVGQKTHWPALRAPWGSKFLFVSTVENPRAGWRYFIVLVLTYIPMVRYRRTFFCTISPYVECRCKSINPTLTLHNAKGPPREEMRLYNCQPCYKVHFFNWIILNLISLTQYSIHDYSHLRIINNPLFY